MERYQALQSISSKDVQLICHIEGPGDLPADVRRQGPWKVTGTGEILNLIPEYRRALARDGYVLVKCELAVFKPEV
jgi:hypothetical protein